MENQPNNPQEIDLVLMLRQMGLTLKNAGQKLMRHLIFFLMITATGIAAAFFIRQKTPVYYETEGVYLTKTLPYVYCAEKIRQLNQNISNDPVTASVMLHLTPAETGAIDHIHLLPQEPPVYMGTWDSTALPLKFRLSLKDTTLIGKIEKALPPLLESTDFAIRQKEARNTRLTTTSTALGITIQDIERKQQSILGSGAGANPALQLSGLQQLKLQYIIQQEEIKNTDPETISLMVPFSRPLISNTASRDKKYYTTILGSVFMAIAVILVFFPAKKRSI